MPLQVDDLSCLEPHVQGSVIMQMLGPELRRKVLASAEIVSVSRKQELQFCIGGGSKQDPDCFYFVREGELVVNDCSTHGAPVEITCLKARLLVACMAVSTCCDRSRVGCAQSGHFYGEIEAVTKDKHLFKVEATMDASVIRIMFEDMIKEVVLSDNKLAAEILKTCKVLHIAAAACACESADVRCL